MSAILKNKLLFFIFATGILLRIWIGLINPPNNTFDDHLEAISVYAKGGFMPAPQQCWECYQPPLYYFTSGQILNLTNSLGLSAYTSWKIIQFLNTIASIGMLFLLAALLKLNGTSYVIRNLILALWAVLPIDLYASAMITNDYFLIFFTVLSVYFFYKIRLHQRQDLKIYTFLNLSVLLACLSKQQGLILILLPIISLMDSFRKRHNNSFAFKSVILIIALALCMSNEITRHQQSGKWLVSNQEYFNYTRYQGSGKINTVDFFSFRISALMQKPFLSETTKNSFPTEIFARTWYDYESLYVSHTKNSSIILAKTSYILGLFWILVFLSVIIICFIRFVKKTKLSQIPLNIIGLVKQDIFNRVMIISFILILLFSAVPVLQTIRYSFSSSMKTQFMLPALLIMAVVVAKCMTLLSQGKNIKIFVNILIFLTLGYGLIDMVILSRNFSTALAEVGNLMNFPVYP
jgi:hypothetical protein